MKHVLLLAIFLLMPGVASAHQLATDRTIGAVLHINPSDDPIAGEESGFYFEFQDTDNKFSFAHCQCTAVVRHNNTELASRELTQASSTSGTFSYALPERGAYEIVVIGIPQEPGYFQPFSLSYAVRVGRGERTTKNVPAYVWVGGTCAAVLALGALAFASRPRAKVTNPQGGGTGNEGKKGK
ncbi:MAG TPA: hypothetical protein VLA04_06845 [Verrucomicrobiae bacterium]|nr:hypothetical protein [Verrucomicrobiae bacterium]